MISLNDITIDAHIIIIIFFFLFCFFFLSVSFVSICPFVSCIACLHFHTIRMNRMELHWKTFIASSHIIVISVNVNGWWLSASLRKWLIQTFSFAGLDQTIHKYIYNCTVIALGLSGARKIFSSFVVLLFALKWDIIGNLNDERILVFVN